jgi:hypothetical protein
MNQQVQDFYNHLNEAVMTTNDFAEGTRFRKREKVNQFAYCGLNPMYRSYLSFDLDCPDAGRKFEELKVPVPSIITHNRANGHAHYLYRLITPVAYHKSAHSKPQDFFEAVEDQMTIQLKADPAFTHTLTKNPLHDRWIVESFPASYHLSDFQEYFDLPTRTAIKAPTEKCEIRGRNDELFHTLRYWAYSAIHSHTHEEQWLRAVRLQADTINSCFGTPLPDKEVGHTSKSVGRGVWKYRNSIGYRPKVLQFTNETPTERMQAGAAYTNQVRKDTALAIVRKAHQELLPIYGAKLTPRLLATHTQQNIKTVRKYLPLI